MESLQLPLLFHLLGSRHEATSPAGLVDGLRARSSPSNFDPDGYCSSITNLDSGSFFSRSRQNNDVLFFFRGPRQHHHLRRCRTSVIFAPSDVGTSRILLSLGPRGVSPFRGYAVYTTLACGLPSGADANFSFLRVEFRTLLPRLSGSPGRWLIHDKVCLYLSPEAMCLG